MWLEVKKNVFIKAKCNNSYLVTDYSEDFHIYEIYKGMDMRYFSFHKRENIIRSANVGEQL